MKIIKKLFREFLWTVTAIFPVKRNKVILQSYYGRGFSDSPKAIAQELLRRGGFRLYWAVKDPAADNELPEGVRSVTYDSAAFIYHMRTAGFWIDNSRKWRYMKKRKKTRYIQTWHGFALKRIEKDAGTALPPDYIKAAMLDSQKCDLMISDSRHMSEIYRSAFWYDGEILEVGLPRNDMLVTESGEAVRRELGAGEGEHLALYAPTFRADHNLDCYAVDYDALRGALEKRFGGKWTVLVKLHSNLDAYADQLKLNGEGVKNFSRYPDIQKLYLACDILITDYSSVMFDYMLTSKPCFLFAVDLEDYKKDRNFYMPIESLPFPLCRDNRELSAAVEGFDEEEYRARLGNFREKYGILCDGKASEAVVDWMQKKLS